MNLPEDNPITLALAEAYRWLLDLDDNTADLIITDPPYSSGGQFRGDRTSTAMDKYVTTETKPRVIHSHHDFAGDNRDQRAYSAWCALWLTEALRVTVPGGSLFIFTDWRQLPTTTDAIQIGGWVWRGLGTWHKNGGRPVTNGLRPNAEFFAHGTKGSRRTDYEHYQDGVIAASTPSVSERTHITEKPVDLIRPLTKFAPPGGLVLDPFAGSGTTAIACHLEGRRFAGSEVHPGIHAQATARIAEAQNQASLFGP